ncbi:MAG TPA: hypothetical protein VMT68_15070 [Caulobacteraceae bacterium]|nr:hypothetical protein [Caulobacteraceae bacterium]
MGSESQFWWNWGVSAIGAFGTVAAVIVALFGNRLQRWLFPPRLTVNLADSGGVKGGYTLIDAAGQRVESEARWYHALVANPTRWPAVTQVQVALRQIEEVDALGKPCPIWAGDTPLQWAHKGDRPLLLNIGHAAEFDLFSVVKEGWLDIHPLAPLESQSTRWPDKAHIFLTVQARGIEGDSPATRFEVAWDGAWSDDRTEMARHVVVRATTPAEV